MFLTPPFQAVYLEETILTNVDLTISTNSILDLSAFDIRTVVEDAFKISNEELLINDIDVINTTSNYDYHDDNNHLVYAASLFVYFQNKEAYDKAIAQGYKQSIYNDIPAFIQLFETNIMLNILSSLNISDPYFISSATINSFKATQLSISDNIGIALIKYNVDTQTLTTPMGPTVSPSFSMNPTTQTTMASNIELKHCASPLDIIWIAILFLFIGCCFGGCFWYTVCSKLQILSFMKANINEQRRNVQKQSQNQRDTNRNTNVSIEITKRKKKAKTRNQRARSEEGLAKSDYKQIEKERAKRQRYIEYGSEDDSEREREIEKNLKKRKRKKRQQQKQPQSTKIRQRYDFSSSDDEQMDGKQKPDQSSNSSESPKPSTKMKQPVRYDDDGNRILSTKELLAKYKNQRQRGGDSVDITDYRLKIGKEEQSVEENDEINDPHYRPSKKLKRRSHRHKRSATVDYGDKLQHAQKQNKMQKKRKKKRSKRPRSARYRKSDDPKFKRPKIYTDYDDSDDLKEKAEQRRRYNESSDDTVQSSA